MFVGTHDVKVDGQGGASFPLAFRTSLTKAGVDTVFIFPGLHDESLSLTGCNERTFNALIAASSRWDANSAEFAQFMEDSVAQADPQQVDGKNRITLPRERFAVMGIKETVRFVGYGHWFHAWAPDKHEVFRKTLRESGQRPQINLYTELSRIAQEHGG